jgi:hypothetical protein
MTVTHRMSHTPEHNTWLEMRRRCEDPSRNKKAWKRITTYGWDAERALADLV